MGIETVLLAETGSLCGDRSWSDSRTALLHKSEKQSSWSGSEIIVIA